MKKIALPTRNGLIDDHFGHCEFYTIFTVDEENRISRTQVLPSPQGCGCKSDIASKLQADGVTVMLAGNMGGWCTGQTFSLWHRSNQRMPWFSDGSS